MTSAERRAVIIGVRCHGSFLWKVWHGNKGRMSHIYHIKSESCC